MEEIIQKGFDELIQDCRKVTFIDFINHEEIPKNSIKNTISDSNTFDHDYSDLNHDYFDVADFYGHIYLPTDKDNIKYLKFEVKA